MTVVEIAGVSAGISKYSMYLGHIHQYQPWKLCKNLVGGGWKLAIFVAIDKNSTNSVTSGNKIQIFAPLHTLTSFQFFVIVFITISEVGNQ